MSTTTEAEFTDENQHTTVTEVKDVKSEHDQPSTDDGHSHTKKCVPPACGN